MTLIVGGATLKPTRRAANTTLRQKLDDTGFIRSHWRRRARHDGHADRAARWEGLARAAVSLAWLRLGMVIIGLAVVVLTLGASAAALLPLVGIVLAVGDACGGLIITGGALRRISAG
ncbi:hypothetical protein [Actinoplanes flavus]|uniref:Uncharacterized protein n=1 Tax=Actinoplanes flavus TaxID=2820290 RepID=A0ABS3UL45_9ACTN|nr:hypothetical protein [Actinoplanes flavus]MBO3739484.1 hypothetical protein [Actinoplanes flavus]